MSLTKPDFSNYIKAFNFRELFNFMGWDNDKTIQPIVVDNETFTLQAVGEKSGFKILLCNPQSNGLLPNYSTRKKIETKVTKLFQEHLIIFFDKNKTEQIWQLVVRQSGKPTKVTETRWRNTQDPELLYQRAAGIFFELDEEDKITIVDVKSRVGQNFHQNNEKITKQFYDNFKKEHRAFLQFIQGISDETNKDWYASLMLNRLMFCYFIQKKGFLDNNKNYLRDKLEASTLRQAQGAKAQKFFSFYRDFLLVLFHKGLNEPTQNWDIKIEIGKIPYLNGGLFDEHELERAYTNIDIEDTAFKQLFDFFDQYEWHLDTSVTATGKDINPDVIGYIFEKYINDRANMGAYYTKEDITDYISKNCILPFLFDETKRNYPKGFNADGDLWQMVKTSGDRYIYDAVKKGVEEPLPIDIEQGINEVSERSEWNKPATNTYALPTEIWREVVDRRNRYTEVKTKIDKGEINAINDFITYNLNIRQFAQDVVENTTDPELLKHFYKALNSVTIIDPTCGSGAFLFAAMNILEPLYESCIQRMENFVAEATKGKYKYFEEVLAQVKSPEHPNLQYFIYKSIILRNLYGVDIMKEAVEIAKLRLFLKLVATVEADYRKPNLGLEPLPDIDFNIRAGNTLVGFATEVELQNGLTYTFDGVIAKPLIEEKCEIVSGAFKRYKEIQLTFGDDFNEFKKAKTALNERLKELNHDLNKLLHMQATAYQYEDWLQSHQPFHWFAEFYEIIKENGGFDVIIGNPPYVECSKVKYSLDKYTTLKAGNLYALVTENCLKVMKSESYIGMIVQNSIVCTKRMLPIQKLLVKRFDLYLSNYDDRPAKLFTGIHHMKGTIFIGSPKVKTNQQKTTKFYRWAEEFRPFVFDTLEYSDLPQNLMFNGHLSKYSSGLQKSILHKIYKQKALALSLRSSGKIVYCHRIASYFVKAIDFIPYFFNEKLGQKKSDDYKEYFVENDEQKYALVALLNSSIFYINWHTLHDGYHCGKKNIEEFPFEFPNNSNVLNKLSNLGKSVTSDIQNNSFRKETLYKNTGVVIYDEFYPKKSKQIINDIDKVLADHYEITDEELDFIINYDIKYRMGKELDNGDE
jgi:tRNA1(Val) A37 N6-methylase TrmN6